MTKRQADRYESYRTLQRNGLDFANFNHISPNSGSETFKHLVAKAAVAHIGINNGYWVASEVETEYGEIDVCLWGHPERLTYAVECENSPTKEVKQDKLERYVNSQPGVDDMVLINVSNMPVNILDALGYVSEQIGLDP